LTDRVDAVLSGQGGRGGPPPLTLLLPRIELLAELVRGTFSTRVRASVLALVHHARQARDEGRVERREEAGVVGAAEM